MRPLKDFLTKYVEIEVVNSGQPFRFPVEAAYAVDKPADDCKKGPVLRNELKMGSCHCCDYIIPRKDEVLLLEDSNLKEKKKQLEYEWLYFGKFIREEEIKNIFSKKLREKVLGIIKNEQLLKAYASLWLLCRLVSQNTEAKELMENKPIGFVVIINDISDNQEQEFRAFQNLGSRIRSSLGTLVKVRVLPLKEAKALLSQ